MAYNDTSKITIPLVLGDKESKLKVGKILDPIVHENSLINTTDGKSYTITEKRNNKQDNNNPSDYSSRSYDQGYNDGYDDGYMDHDDYHCHDDYDCSDSCDCDTDCDDYFDF